MHKLVELKKKKTNYHDFLFEVPLVWRRKKKKKKKKKESLNTLSLHFASCWTAHKLHTSYDAYLLIYVFVFFIHSAISWGSGVFLSI